MSRTGKKNTVDRTRVTWVWLALAVSMSIGTVVLLALEPRHVFPTDKTTYLAATWNTDSSARISRTAVPIENELWKSIVVHTMRNSDPNDLTLKCLSNRKTPNVIAHFAVSSSGEISKSRTWYNQEPAEGCKGKILIGLQLDEGQADPSLTQVQAMVALIHELQALCNVPRSKVCVHGQLSGKACSNDPLYRYKWRDALLQ
ncbi:MAG: N-acetylmuramoyl-L-alanine amidase [Phycisphaerae bacterium]